MSKEFSIDTEEATQLLKDILNVGKPDQSSSGGSVSENICGNLTNGNMEVSAEPLRNLGAPNLTAGSGDEVLKALFRSSWQKQEITFTGDEGNFSFEIYNKDVTIYPSPSPRPSGSSKIKIQNIVDYGWEYRYYWGKLVACHNSSKFLAYVIKAPNTVYGAVRVMNCITGERELIKGMKGQVVDLCFAHSSPQVLLACVDETGCMFVYEIQGENEKLQCKLKLQVDRTEEPKSGDIHRVIWCPFIPDDPGVSEDVEEIILEDSSKLLVLTHNEKAEMWHVDMVSREYGHGPIMVNQVEIGYQAFQEHQKPIIDAAFSPEGTALATASLDGEVKFFQVYMQNKSTSPRCLHQWIPHDGKPLSCLFFLDNHKDPKPDIQFWKFAITGAENNQELKVWSCETWECLQTVRFTLKKTDNVQPSLRAELDHSSSYLLLSDINRNGLYVLQIHQDHACNVANICSVSEFFLTLPVLSLSIKDAGFCKLKSVIGLEHVEHMGQDLEDNHEDDDLTETYVKGTVIRLFWINTKSLQDCRIVYQSAVPVPQDNSESLSSLSRDSFVYRDGLSDISVDNQNGENDVCVDKNPVNSTASILAQTPVLSSSVVSLSTVTPVTPGTVSSYSTNFQSSTEVLLTPDHFTSPSHTSGSPAVSSSSFTPSSVPLPPVTPSEEANLATSNTEDNSNLASQVHDTPLATSEKISIPRRKSSHRSSASTPSQEVASILSSDRELEKQDDGELVEDQHTEELVEELGYQDNKSTYSMGESLICNGSTVSVTALSEFSHKAQFGSMEWPHAPDPTKDYRLANSGSGTEISQSTESTHTFPQESGRYNLHRLEVTVEGLSRKVSAMMDLMHAERSEIREIQSILREQIQQHKALHNQVQRLDRLDSSICSRVENVLTKQAQSEFAKMQTLFTKREDSDRQWLERQASTLSQAVTLAVGNKLDKAIKNEIKNLVLPNLTKFFDNVKDQIQQEVTQKLTAADNVVKDSIGKMMKNKSLMDNISQSLATSIHSQIQDSCREVFQAYIIPSYERACQQLFHQLNDTFQHGIKEYLQQTESWIERQIHQNQNVTQISSADMDQKFSQIQSALEKHVSSSLLGSQDLISQQFQENLSRALDGLIGQVQATTRDELRLALQEHQTSPDASVSSLRSRAITPVPHCDPQAQLQQILHLFRQGQVNAAFQQALCVSDVNIVLKVCESVTTTQVFGPPCPLQQQVLLSLIHQLSQDFSTKTELRYNYISEALMNLDTSNPLTREHFGLVLSTLEQKLSTFIQHNPQHKQIRNLKMLRMAAHSLHSSNSQSFQPV
ncbi:enhancer of mRNA-decapping protein 4 homolog Ge-1 [Tachypleus tridentatus]|uniref:enhancer of mRNA-decapping protein 4 homolog Ge-1 n=1 Tax=Tachypleus tridentatus TaxID=6853 RepID=UPI003FD65F3C